MRPLIRAIKRSTLTIVIFAVLTTGAVFVPPVHHAAAAAGPSISLNYNYLNSTYYLTGQGFSAGGSVWLGRYNDLGQPVQSTIVTAAQCLVVLVPYLHCSNNVAPGTFTYYSSTALTVSGSCGMGTYYAYDYKTSTWSNPIYTYTCVH